MSNLISFTFCEIQNVQESNCRLFSWLTKCWDKWDVTLVGNDETKKGLTGSSCHYFAFCGSCECSKLLKRMVSSLFVLFWILVDWYHRHYHVTVYHISFLLMINKHIKDIVIFSWDCEILLKLWNLVKIVIFGWYCDIWLILWYLADIVIFGWYCDIWSKLWTFFNIVIFGWYCDI